MELNKIKAQNKKSFWVPNNLKVVFEAIDKECAIGRNTSNNQSFIDLLKTLDSIERSFVANYFSQLSWNVSSVRVLGCLNRLRYLTATEYILSQTDEEHIQLVLNDFLETDFDLISNLVISGHYDLMIGSKISEYVDESIRRLFIDLDKDPKLNNLQYLNALNHSIPKELYAKLVSSHLQIVLLLHKSTAKYAFAKFSEWMQPNADDFELVSNFYHKAVKGNDLNIVRILVTASSTAHFIGWRNYLLLLGMITKNSPTQCYSFIKKWLKDRLKTVAERGSIEVMAHLLLSIRAVLISQEDQTETYAKWYKQYIGDMKFVFDATEFKTVVNVLSNLVTYETDEEYLQVHAKTSISPPVMCSELCRNYKALCKTRIAVIADCSSIVEIDGDLFPNA